MSSFSQAVHPLFEAMAWLLALFFGLVPNYAFAIAMLTVVVMVALSPLTLKSTRSMLAMQRLAPEIKKLQQRYKGDRQRLSEETMALYKEHGASPAGGCLPMLLQMPAFIILYDTIRGLTNTVGPHHIPEPRYISHSTALYQHLIAGHGTMMAFGIDLAKSATSVHGGFLTALPFYLLVVGSIGLQFLQMRQLTNRNPQAATANPQMQAMQKFMPLIFGFIYISIAAGVNIYFLVSSLLRILQQELMYRYDPTLREAVGKGPIGQGSSVGKQAIEAKASPAEPGIADSTEPDVPSSPPAGARGGLLAALLGGAGAPRPASNQPAMRSTPKPPGASKNSAGSWSESAASAGTGPQPATRPPGRLLDLFGSRLASGGVSSNGSGKAAQVGNGKAAQVGNGTSGTKVHAKANGNARPKRNTKTNGNAKPKPKAHPRSQSKRARKPR